MKTTNVPVNPYTSPKYKIVQRRGVEFHEMTHELDAKLNLTIPHELVVTIDLPLLTTTDDANLDVLSKRISLVSEKPAKYKLDIALPYEVEEENGNAKFDKSKRQLIITLPVVQKSLKMIDFHREDSGIESDQHRATENSDETESPVDGLDEDEDESVENSDEKDSTQQSDNFMESNTDYVLPSFTFNHIDDILAFTLHVKNVDPSSIAIDRKDLLNIAYIKFTSIGSGFFPIHYSFCVKFPSQRTSIFRDITAEAWDNNIIFQFELNNYDFSSYEVGLNETELQNYNIAERLIGRQAVTSQGKQIEDDSLSIEVRSDKETELVIEVNGTDGKNQGKKKQNGVGRSKKSHETTSNDDEVSEDVFDQSVEDGAKRQNLKKAMKKRAKKGRSLSESYCDQLKVINENAAEKSDERKSKGRGGAKNQRSLSNSSDEDALGDIPVQTHQKYKSILKNRNSYSECNEMSSVDDHHEKQYYSVSADFGICQSHDSLSESCKKQVRFSDIIKRQLFR